MSDGPHKSLPMRKHWKILAERADKAAYSEHEVSEALPAALRAEFREIPLEQLKKALGASEQAGLFSAQSPSDLEPLRAACPGSAAGNLLIDCAKEALANGLRGEEACAHALDSALEECSRSAFRGMEEHYYREAPEYRARNLRFRLDAARNQCDFASLSQAILRGSGQGGKDGALARRSGLDEGPELR